MNQSQVTIIVTQRERFSYTQPSLESIYELTTMVIDHRAIANYKKVKPIDIKELEVKRSRQQTDSNREIKLYKFVDVKQHN